MLIFEETCNYGSHIGGGMHSVRHPDRARVHLWNLFMSNLLLYVAFATPYRVCFAINTTVTDASFWLNVFVDTVFILDIVLNFRTAYIIDEQTGAQTQLHLHLAVVSM
eukprot:SAG31_NODE_602_length_13638_cov_32.936037_3_plen_108_part_00